MPHFVYVLCALASATCSALLFRGYRRSAVRLLFWGAVCFGFLTGTNILLFVDLIIFPDVDLFPLRSSVTLAGLSIFLYGLISESK